MSRYLTIKDLRIQNANALSSPYTIGFPAMTAWLGAIHALERRLRQIPKFETLRMPRMAVSCHAYNLQTYRGIGDTVQSIIITANPLRKKGKDFERPPFIEEARIHLKVSLLVEVCGLSTNADVDKEFLEAIKGILPIMKFAGGDILYNRSENAFAKLSICNVSEEDKATVRKAIRGLMPGYVLIERRDLLEEKMRAGANSLDALMQCLAIHNTVDENGEWQKHKSQSGWIVPISVGYKGLTPLGKAANQRDPSVPHRFAENVVTLGEFRMAHRFDSLEEILWHYEAKHDLYVCKNQLFQ